MQTLTELKVETDRYKIWGDFNMPFSIRNKTLGIISIGNKSLNNAIDPIVIAKYTVHFTKQKQNIYSQVPMEHSWE